MKKKISVDFTGFWPNFVKTDNYFYHLLSTKYLVEVNQNNPDLLFYSVDYSNKKDHLNNNYSNSKKIFYTGENVQADFEICNGAFSFTVDDNKYNYRLPLWVLHINWFQVKHNNKRDQSYLIDKYCLLNDKKIFKSNKKFCSFIASNPSGERLNFAKKLNQKIKVDSGGKLLNNSGKIVKGRGDQKWKIKFLSKYRFNIAFENTIGNGYVTEKIIHPMSVNSIPIYWGSETALSDFNEDSFIFVNSYNSFEKVIDYIYTLEMDRELYLEKLNKPWFVNNEYPKFAQPKNVIEFIEKIMDQ